MRNFNIFSLNICYAFFYFSIYSFLGWCAEICYVLYKDKRLVNKGLLTGPFCPVYGFGACILVAVFDPLKSNHVLLFTASAIFMSVLEYIAGYVLEKSFKKVWWNKYGIP